MTLNAGAKLGWYEIRSKIGEGGMGEPSAHSKISLRQERDLAAGPSPGRQNACAPTGLWSKERAARL